MAKDMDKVDASELASFPKSTMARIMAEGLSNLEGSELPAKAMEKVLSSATAEQVAELPPEVKEHLLAMLSASPVSNNKRTAKQPARKRKEK